MTREEALVLLQKASPHFIPGVDGVPVASEHRQELIDWVEALRSGQYQQAHMQLYIPFNGENKEGFCCLGLFCRVVRGVMHDMTVDCGEGMGAEPAAYPRSIGVDMPITSNTQDALAWLNDGTTSNPKLSFSEIADVIEAVYL